MELVSIVTLLLSFLQFTALAKLTEPSTCRISFCSCAVPDVLDCEGQGLREFDVGPSFNSTGLKVLKLSNNALFSIPDLSIFTDLHTLDLSYNKITSIGPGGFRSLPQLLHLDISFNDIILSSTTITTESFTGLRNLTTLKLKQAQATAPGFDYSALEPLADTLEELYIIGTVNYSPVFKKFARLHTLSLGGSACDIPSLTNVNMDSLSLLPLKRLSAKNCAIKEIDRQFLHNFQQTLLKLDLSCNHLRHYFKEITNGVANSSLNTLILDHINTVGNDSCQWVNISNADVLPLRTTPLKILSMQANHLGMQSTLDLRSSCSKLIYLDLSQNDFGDAAFQIAQTIKGQKVPTSDYNLFHSGMLQPPSVRYFGLQGLTRSLECGVNPNSDLLDCNVDSYLFLEDEYYWDHNFDPDIMDFQLLTELVETVDFKFGCAVFGCQNPDTVVTILTELTRNKGVDYISDKAINRTIHHIWNESGGFRNIFKYISNIRYFLSNCTTLALGYNNFGLSDDPNENPICSNLAMFPNNVERLDLSHSTWGYIPCRGISGFKYLTNLTCRYCEISGWHEDFFSAFPLEYLDMTGNRLGIKLREDQTGKVFHSAPGLRYLYLGKQTDGIQSFANPYMFSNYSNLTYLDLHGNELTSWNISVSMNTKLQHLDLRDNNIPYISKHVRDEIDNQQQLNGFQVYLEGNDVLCSLGESQLAYINWLLASPAVPNADRLICKGKENTPIDSYNKVSTMKPNETIPTKKWAVIVVTSVITLAVLIVLAISYVNRYTLLYRWYKHRNTSSAEGIQTNHERRSAYASHTNPFTDKLVGLIREIDGTSVRLLSRELDILPGHMIRAATARLIAESDKVVMFVTPDYMKEDMTKFEFELLKQKGPSKLLVVTVGIDSPSQIEHLPALITNVIVREEHLVWPAGLCAASISTYKAFVQTLLGKLVMKQSADL